MTNHFEGYVADLCSGYRPMVLEPMGCRDHLILLKNISLHMQSLSDRSLLSLQKILPMSLQGLLDSERQTAENQIHYENLMDEACMSILVDRLRNRISSMLDTEDKLKVLDRKTFLNIANQYHQENKAIGNMMQKSNHNFKLTRLKYLNEEIIEKIQQVLLKVEQTSEREYLAQFAQLLVDTGLIYGSPAEIQLARLLDIIDDTFDKITQSYLSFQKEVSKRSILTEGVSGLLKFSMEKVVFDTDWYYELAPLVKDLVDKLVDSMRDEFLKPYNDVKKFNMILGAIRSNLQLLYFSFNRASKELDMLISTRKRISEWELRVSQLEQKLSKAQEFDRESLLSSTRRSELLVSEEEFTKVFRSLGINEEKLVKIHPKYLLLRPKEIMISNEDDDEEVTFEEVMEHIKDCNPVTKKHFAVIKEEALRYRIDHLLQHKIRVREQELNQMIDSLSSESAQDRPRLAKLHEIQNTIKEVMSEGYPENVPVNSRLHDLETKNDFLTKVLIDGECKEKLRRLSRVFGFVTEVESMFGSQGINRTSTELLMSDSDSFSDVDWSKMEFLKKSLFFRNRCLALFPKIEDFVQKVYASYMNYLVNQASTHGEKTDISTILLIETIYYYLKHKPELTQIYKKRRDNLAYILRGSVDIVRSSDLSLADLKSRIEGLQDRMRHLKGFSDDRKSKICQAFMFINQLETIALLLRRVKVFRREDVKLKNREMYRVIAQGIRCPGMKDLPLKKSDLNCPELNAFIEYFDKVDTLVEEWLDTKRKITEIRCRLSKAVNNNGLSEAIICIFELPDANIGERLQVGMQSYDFLIDMVSMIRDQLSKTSNTQKHLEDDIRYKKMVDGIEQFKSSSTRKELQVYIKYVMVHQLPDLGFTNDIINAKLRFIWVFNKLAGLLYENITLADLKDHYKAALASEKCDAMVKQKLKTIKVISTIVERIEKAEVLSDQLNDCQNMSADKYFKLLSKIRNSSVKLGDKLMDNYLSVMQKIEDVYFTANGSSLTTYLTLEEYQYSTKSMSVPSMIEIFVMKNFKVQVDFQKWMISTLYKDHPRKLEVDAIIDLKLLSNTEQFRDLQDLQAAQDNLLNEAATNIEGIVTGTLDGHATTLDTVHSALASLTSVAYHCESEQQILLTRLLLWTLKETRLLNRDSGKDAKKMLLTMKDVGIIAEIASILKNSLICNSEELALEASLKIKESNGAQRSQDSQSRSIIPRQILELLEDYLTPVELISQKLIEVSVRARKSSISDLTQVNKILKDLKFPDQIISKINMVSLLESHNDSTEASPIKEIIENELLDTDDQDVTEICLVDSIDFDHLLKEIEILFIDQNSKMVEILNGLIKAADFSRSSIEASLILKEVSATVSVEHKKSMNKKVTSLKQINNKKLRNDQKENQLVNKGKLVQTGKRSAVMEASRKTSQSSNNVIANQEHNIEKVHGLGDFSNGEGKQLRKRKPDISNAQMPDIKEEKKGARSMTRPSQELKVTLFDSLTLRSNGKTVNGRKTSFITQLEGMNETLAKDLGLTGTLELEIQKQTSKDQFDFCKSQIQAKKPLIYGTVNIKSNETSNFLDECQLWEGFNGKIGRVWLFNSNYDKDLVKDYHFLPSSATLNSKSYVLFIMEKRLDGKPVDSSAEIHINSKAMNSSQDSRKLNNSYLDQSNSHQPNKIRSTKDGRAARPKKKGRGAN